MRKSRFFRQLHRVLTEQRLIAKGDGVILAVSGGPDSMALLHGLAGVNATYELGLRLHVAHLNHGTRGADSDGDAAFVAAAAAALNLPATVETVNVPARLGPAGGGLERAGRQARYAFFTRLARRENCALVATGHHGDDNVETILQRIIRGTGPRGLAGIPPIRPLGPDAVLDDGRQIQLVRPLLAFRRRMILRFLEANQIAFRTDASNLAPEPTRNWLRHELLPLLAKRGNPGVAGALLRLGELSGWVNTFLEDTARRSLAALIVDRTDVELALNAAALAGRGEILQAELIRQAILSLGLAPGREAEIGLRHLKAVMRLLPASAAPDDQSGKWVNLPGGMTVERRGGQLVIRRGDDAPGDDATTAAARLAAAGQSDGVTVALPGRTVLIPGRRELSIELLTNSPGLIEQFKATRTAYEELIGADQLHPPLLVRMRRAGDRFWPLGASGNKKIADFLSDRKVPLMDRDRVWMLCDQLGPVWVIPHRIDDRVRVTERSGKLLKMRVEIIG